MTMFDQQYEYVFGEIDRREEAERRQARRTSQDRRQARDIETDAN